MPGRSLRTSRQSARCSPTSSYGTAAVRTPTPGRATDRPMTELLIFKDIDEPGLNTREVYERRGGYQQLRRALEMPREAVLQEISDSGLRGRGGAGFRMGQKAGFLPKGDMPKYLTCNADESEPGTFKDREIMQKTPHMLIEGIVISCYGAAISEAFIYIRGEYQLPGDILEAAIQEAYAAGYLGENIL